MSKQILKFSATWCGPCKMMAPIVDDVTKELGIDLVSYDVDDDGAGELAAKYSVRGVPTLVYLVDGEVKKTLVGAITKSKLVEQLQSVT